MTVAEAIDELQDKKSKMIVGSLWLTAAYLTACRLQMPVSACAYFAQQAGLYGAIGCVFAIASKRMDAYRSLDDERPQS